MSRNARARRAQQRKSEQAIGLMTGLREGAPGEGAIHGESALCCLSERNLTSRSFTLRAQTVNEQERSVEAVIATEEITQVMDYRTWEMIDETLVMDGANLPGQVPMLESHARWSLDSVMGSIRNLRIENSHVVGRLYFAKDEASERAWAKVRDGHITDVSAGYSVDGYVDIQPGQTQNINGRLYTARDRRLRITTRWTLKEGSLVAIGADPSSKIREGAQKQPTGRSPGRSGPTSPREFSMNKHLRKFLESKGLKAGATDQEARDFMRSLAGEDAIRAEALAGIQDEPASPAPASEPAGQRVDTPAPGADPQAIAIQAVRAERERVEQIRALAGDEVPQEQVQQAIREGWSVERASRTFLEAIRAGRAPAIHTMSSSERATPEVLGAALAIRAGTNMLPSRLTGEARAQRERILNQAERFADLSLLDMIRMAGAGSGVRVPIGRNETLEFLRHDVQRAGAMTAQLSNVFTTSVNARLMQAWEEYPDSTTGWVSEVDVADFKTNDRIGLDKVPGLSRLPRGGTAKEATFGDVSESYKVFRFAKKATIDEQDIIDDNMSVFQTIPSDLGEAARRLRPDIVYALLLANANLSDGGALFNATATTTAGGHANLSTGGGSALSATSLQAGIVAMAKQKYNNVNLNLMAAFLIVPQDLRFTAEILLASAERVISADSGGTYNPLKSMNIQLRSDNRIGVAGVTDPISGTARTGTATNWFITTRPGRTIEVGYISGTGRRPQVRPYTLAQGQWGMGWDINMDIGAKALDYRGLYKADGA